ncbi:serine hydrolase domain-containing protein [Legionella brunensis]|uniref:Beta-lactamase n=1 Tax=Legionella brunensis TaxID=29422 RepID=A0A0W0SQ47_9GAMM|nr:serine hydrolase domain-containing protein [Legionella brunensis]KTC85125.1 beta-lactamase [Legionella brunensis]
MNKKGFYLIFISCFQLFSWQWLHSATAPTVEQEIDNVITHSMQQYAIPGLAIAILKDGKPLLLKGYGYADIQLKQPVDSKTLFGIGSVSKVITAFALMTLVQEGKINLDDSVLKYIPQAPEQWQAVTIRELLSHTSGIPQHQGPHRPWGKLWLIMANEPVQFAPCTDVKYNNFGYILLGRVIENVSRQSLADYLKQTVFKPLGMADTGFPDVLFPQGLATGYRIKANMPVSSPNYKPWLQMWSSGGLVSSISDMAKWDAAMSSGKILAPSSYRQMWSPVFLKNGKPAGHGDWAWSLGWQVSYVADELVAMKNGAIRGYSSWIVRHIDKNLSIIILANTNKVPLKRIAKQVFKQIIPIKNE